MHFESLPALIIWVGVIFIASFIGGIIPLLRQWKDAHINQFISFGAGILISTAFLFMLPEATELVSSQAGLAILMGFLVFYFLEKFVMVHPCIEGECEFHHIGPSAFMGFSLHSFIDGVALGSSILVPEITGVVFFALLAHRVPTSFAFTSILKATKYETKKIYVLLIIFALTLPLGAVIARFWLANGSHWVLGMVIGFSAGTFIHIATCDILPQIHKDETKRKGNLLAFIFGLAIMLCIYFFLGHSH